MAISTIELKRGEHRTIDGLKAAAKRSLAPGEVWCIWHTEGPLPETASTDFVQPIVTICEALKMEWDDLQEQGFYLGKMRGA